MKKPISSRLQISLIMMIFIIPLVLFLIIYNLYTINFYNRRIAQTGQESISLYQNSLEEDLRDATTQMQYFIAVGFHNFSHFSQTYKKIMGVSPVEQRAQNGKV